jgi:L-lactate dehydrogenase complex protein LldG
MDDVQTHNINLFLERFKLVNGIPLVAENPEQAALHTADLIASNGGKTVYIASAFDEVLQPLQSAAEKYGITVYKDLRGREALEKLKQVDASVTAAAAAVAETGAVVEVAYDDAVRLASSLPKIHVMLLKSSTIYRSVSELSSLLREALNNRTAAVTLISGPSRSGDIEQRLVVGIHGPHVVAAVVLK